MLNCMLIFNIQIQVVIHIKDYESFAMVSFHSCDYNVTDVTTTAADRRYMYIKTIKQHVYNPSVAAAATIR